MVVCLCATRKMYPQLQTLILMLQETQPSLKKIFAFVEDDFEVKSDLVTFINVSNFTEVTENKVNDGGRWTYMTLIRCYFTDLLPQEDKVLYLDLDIMIEEDISELWNMDMGDYEVAGVIDENINRFRLPYLRHLEVYINGGVLLMNLKQMRLNETDKKINDLLHTWKLTFGDQDTINLTCKVMQLDCKWNSSAATAISNNPMIHHVIHTKPWNPNSKWFPKWATRYLESGAHQSVSQV